MKLSERFLRALARNIDGIEVSPKVGTRAFGSAPVAGVAVDEDSAIGLSALYGCARYISGSVSVMPWGVYLAAGSARIEQRNHKAWGLLRIRPSELHSPAVLKEALVWNALLTGNGYAEITQRDGLFLLDSNRMTVFRTPTNRLLYRYVEDDGTTTDMLPAQVFHLRGPSRDGIVGMSIISAARDAISNGLALQAFGASFFGNGTHVGGVYQTDQTLTDVQFDRLRAQIDADKGARRAHRPRILEGGMKYVADTIPPQDAQFLEQRKFSAREMCGLFGVPPHKVGLEDGATAYASREQAAIEAVVDCLLPWVTRLEQEGDYKLISPQERARGIYTHLNMDVLMRGDAKSRAEANQIRFRNGALTADEWRALEELDSVDGGSDALVSRDLIPLAKANDYADSQIAKNEPADYSPLLTDARERILKRASEDRERGRDTHDFARRVVAPLIQAGILTDPDTFIEEAIRE